MKLIFSYLGEFMNETIEYFRQTAAKQLKSDEQYAYRQMTQHFAVRNSKNIIVTSVIGIIVLLVFLAIRTLSCGTMTAIESALYVVGYMLLFFDFVSALALNVGALGKRQVNYKLLQKLFYLFWGAFALGMLLLTISQIASAAAIVDFFVMYIAMLLFAQMKVKETLIFGVSTHLTLLIAYSVSGYGAGSIIIVLLLLAAFLLLSATISEKLTTTWIYEKELSTANERCKQMAEKDLFTGLLNKGGLTRKMKEQTAHDSDSVYGVILADIDNFRKFGILYGDEEANSCLYNVCNCIRIISKAHTDIISRFGEDDFIIVLRDVSEYDLISLSEQLRDSVETMALPFGDEVVTVTLGVSSIGRLKTDNAFSVLMQEADRQLVIAKKGGKNCIGYKGRVFRTDDNDTER